VLHAGVSGAYGVGAARVARGGAIGTAEQKVADLKAQTEVNRDLSTSLAFHEEPAVQTV
jgi:hypothetical protein